MENLSISLFEYLLKYKKLPEQARRLYDKNTTNFTFTDHHGILLS